MSEKDTKVNFSEAMIEVARLLNRIRRNTSFSGLGTLIDINFAILLAVGTQSPDSRVRAFAEEHIGKGCYFKNGRVLKGLPLCPVCSRVPLSPEDVQTLKEEFCSSSSSSPDQDQDGFESPE